VRSRQLAARAVIREKQGPLGCSSGPFGYVRRAEGWASAQPANASSSWLEKRHDGSASSKQKAEGSKGDIPSSQRFDRKY